MKEKQKNVHTDNAIIGGLIMFFSYFLTGLVIMAPYTFIKVQTAKYISMGLTFLLLFILGIVPTKKIKHGLRMVMVAGAAIIVGFTISHLNIPIH